MTSSAAARASLWDRIGVVGSVACAVHCTLLPLLAGLAPILGLTALLGERVELTLLTTTGVVGIVGHLRAYRRNHRHIAPGVIFAAGFALVLGGHAFESAWLEPAALGLGGSIVAASHYANLRLCRCCTCCAEDRC
jgi:hypothetical protein